jgi:cytochrome c5
MKTATALAHFPVRWLHPSRRGEGAAPQDEALDREEVLDPHGEERGDAARLEPRGRGMRRHDGANAECAPAKLTTAGFAALVALLLPVAAAWAQNNRTFSSGFRFVEMTGEELFANVCQGCHMQDATGAAGAGTYPSLVGNKNLEAGGYPVHLVVNGRRGMPAFGDMMTDGQIAAVVNYLRTHFGNSYQDAVTSQDVKDARR